MTPGYNDDATTSREIRQDYSVWLRLLMPLLGWTCVFGLTFLFIVMGFEIHGALYPGRPWIEMSGVKAALLCLGGFLTAVVPGFMTANVFLIALASARRLLAKRVEDTPGPSYSRIMARLASVGVVTVPIGLMLMASAVFDPFRFGG